MKRFWKVLSGFLVAFLVFAPPGTMIFIGLLLIWLLRDTWWGIPVVLLVAAAGTIFLWNFKKQRDETKRKDQQA